MIESDAEDPLYVYDWRLEPERAMRAEKGKGMSDEQVIKFVDGCESVPSPVEDRRRKSQS